MRRTHHCLMCLILLLLAAGCDSTIIDEERIGREECDNLDRSQCIFPFPSDHFRLEEGDISRLDFPIGSLPHRQDRDVDPAGFNRRGGFSVISPIYFVLPGATLERATLFDDIDGSLCPSSTTIVLNAETGELMPHWAEIDRFSTLEGTNEDSSPAVITLRLARRLEESTRYIVAVHGMTGENGETLQATPGFAPLREEEPSIMVGVGRRRDHYEENIFPLLESTGIERSSLQLAWDFTTDSEENVTGNLLAMRDALFETIGEDGPEYELTAVEEGNFSRGIARSIRGIARVPSFLEGTRGSVEYLRLDSDGNPVHEGFEEVEFQLQIPVSVWEGDEPGYVVQYGHGLLGSKGEARSRWLQEYSDEAGFLMMAIDMQGMATEDRNIWLDVLSDDISNLAYLAEKPHQGVINHLAMARLLKSDPFSSDPDIVREDGGPAYDPERVLYKGNSQGGTMGGVMMPIQTDITRGVLGVPGGAYNLLLSRTDLFVELIDLVLLADYHDHLVDFTAIMGLLQLSFDPIDAINYMHRLSGDTFPGTPEHRVLLVAAREDAQVHNQITDLVARTAGATLLSPVVREIWGLETSPEPVDGSAMAEYDFGRPAFPNEPVPSQYDTHGCLRYFEPARRQITHFFETGMAENFCDGPCIAPEEYNEQHCPLPD